VGKKKRTRVKKKKRGWGKEGWSLDGDRSGELTFKGVEGLRCVEPKKNK
jgi:hypothetical protein